LSRYRKRTRGNTVDVSSASSRSKNVASTVPLSGCSNDRSMPEPKRQAWERLRHARVDLEFWLNDLPDVLHEVHEIRNPAAHGDGATWADVRRVRALTIDPDAPEAVVPRILQAVTSLRTAAAAERSAARTRMRGFHRRGNSGS